jgi:two-component system chemotaxis response regulator CheY
MPVMNGIQFLKTIQANPRHRHIPVIIISTEGKEEDTVRGLSLGARGYLVKPFNAAGLTAIIDRVLAAPQGASSSATAAGMDHGSR